MPRILLVSYSSNQTSGVGNRVYYLSRELAHLGCDVTVLAPSGQSVSEETNLHYEKASSLRVPIIPPRPLPNVSLFNLQVASKIREIASDQEPIFVDIQHVHFSPMLMLLRKSLKTSKRQFVAITCHGTEAGLANVDRRHHRSLLDLFLIEAEKRTFASSDLIISISRSLKTEIEKSYHGIGNRRIKVVHNGIDMDEFLRARNNIGSTQSWERSDLNHNNSGDVITFLYVGGFVFRKGFDVLLKALHLLRDSFDFRLMLMGPLGSRQDRAYLMGMIHNFGLDSRVIIYPAISRNGALKLMATSDIFVFPSLYEGFGLALLEGMASGRPIVASNISPVREILGEEEESALLVTPGNSIELSNALRRLMADSQLREKLSKSALERAKVFDWKNIALQYKEIVDSFLE